MKINVEYISAHLFLFMRHKGAYGEQNFKLMQDMKDWIKSHNLWSESGTIYGIAQDNPVTTPPEECRYDVCFVTDTVIDDKNIHRGALPAGTYLVCEILHTADAVQQFWGSLEGVLAEKGKQIDQSRPILERYQLTLVEQGYCEFCLPIHN